jgi:DNA segregation ATPase FtsK/SpoIIIE-like protein
LLSVVVLSFAVPRTRRGWGRLWRSRRVRWRWSRATRAAVFRRYVGRSPAVIRLRENRAGEVLTVRIPVGFSVRDLEMAADVLAAALQVHEVRVLPVKSNAARAVVTLVRRDPLTELTPTWPNAGKDALTLWEPIPVGVNEDGDVVAISLIERNMLLGGEPGAGKSVALSALVATAALDDAVQLHLFDGKLVELAPWSRCAEHSVGSSTHGAVQVLRRLQLEMDSRYTALLANGKRRVDRDSGLPLHVLVFDELAHYLLTFDRKERVEFAELLRDLVSRGRAAGFIVVAATQKPSHDVIPTALRDLFGFRWALRCSTPQASDTVLGSGWASAGFSAADVDAGFRGVGYLLHEGERPVRLRSFQLDDEALEQLARRAERLRGVATSRAADLPEARYV